MTRGERGFTLAEVLIAASILAVSLLAIANMFPTAFSNVTSGGESSRAVALAQKKMEEIKGQAFPPAPGSDTTEGFSRSWTVNIGGGPPPNRLATVTVTVTWQSPRPDTFQLVTLIAE
ncbi:MAG: prepilin-type N-terminal cleavage/methylation domain-containing protein [Candidatus Methylomirabilales bacterium]